MDPEPYDVLAVELSSFQLHYTHSMSAESAVVLNVAEDHLDWYDGARTACATTPPTRPAIFERVQRACVYNLADAATEEMVREADVVEGARAVGFTLGTPVARQRRRRRGPARRPRVHRGARHQRRRAVHPRRPRLAGAALRRQRPGRRRAGPRPRRQPAGGARRAARLPPRRPPHRARRGARRRHLGRRLQGHQPARRPVLARRVRPGRLGRRADWPRVPASTTSSSPSASGCAASCCSAGTARSSPTLFRDTRPMCPSSMWAPTRLVTRWSVWSTRPPGSPGPGTRCCWRRAAPPWTCSPTTARRGDAFAAAVHAHGSPAPTDRPARPEGSARSDHREPRGRRRRRSHRRPRAPARRSAPGIVAGLALGARGARQAARLLLPAARLVRAAAHHRRDHGAQRVERALLRHLRRLLRRGEAPADVGRPRRARARGWPPGCRSGTSAGWPTPASSSPSCCSAWSRSFGVLINGNKNWLALGPVNIQPAEIAKLAIVLWAANIYAHKERRLRELHHLLVPVVPGLFAVIGAGPGRPRPRHGHGARRDHARDAVGGRGAACGSSG